MVVRQAQRVGTSIMGVSGGRPAARAMPGTSSQYHSPLAGMLAGTNELGFSLSLITPSICTWTLTHC